MDKHTKRLYKAMVCLVLFSVLPAGAVFSALYYGFIYNEITALLGAAGLVLSALVCFTCVFIMLYSQAMKALAKSKS